MKLNKNSITAKIYRWFYAVKSYELPTDGCEYFKKLILALLLFIPLALITLPITMIGLIFNFKHTISERLAYTVGLYLVFFCLFSMGCSIAILFADYDKNSIIYQNGLGGILIWVVFIIILLIQGVIYLFEYLKEKRYEYNGYNNKKQDNLLVAFYKAKKEKYCPKLEWYNLKK